MEERYPRNRPWSNNNWNEKHVILLGDSTIKNINGYKFSYQLEKGKVYVKSYSGSKIRCMEYHAKPTSRADPDNIRHVGTNDLPTRKNPNETAKSIVQLVLALKSKSCVVSISSITTRGDQYRKKASKNICLENNLYLIHHEKYYQYQACKWVEITLK